MGLRPAQPQVVQPIQAQPQPAGPPVAQPLAVVQHFEQLQADQEEAQAAQPVQAQPAELAPVSPASPVEPSIAIIIDSYCSDDEYFENEILKLATLMEIDPESERVQKVIM